MGLSLQLSTRIQESWKNERQATDLTRRLLSLKSAISLVAIHSHYRRAPPAVVVNGRSHDSSGLLPCTLYPELNGHPLLGCPLSYVSSLVLHVSPSCKTKIRRLLPPLTRCLTASSSIRQPCNTVCNTPVHSSADTACTDMADAGKAAVHPDRAPAPIASPLPGSPARR